MEYGTRNPVGIYSDGFTGHVGHIYFDHGVAWENVKAEYVCGEFELQQSQWEYSWVYLCVPFSLCNCI